jgi:hypothetical protein
LLVAGARVDVEHDVPGVLGCTRSERGAMNAIPAEPEVAAGGAQGAGATASVTGSGPVTDRPAAERVRGVAGAAPNLVESSAGCGWGWYGGPSPSEMMGITLSQRHW